MKRLQANIMTILLTFALIAALVPHRVYADDTYNEGIGATAEAYIVYNSTTGEIVTGKNVHELHYPASITKVMTALLLIEHCYRFDEVITFSHSAVTQISSDSSTLPPVAKEGEKMTVRDVLFGMFLASGNECANLLGEYVAGDTASFAKMMTERAHQIGAKNTNFVNAHGLHDDNHYTTPYDMALIFEEALKNPTFRELASTINYTIPQTNMTPPRVLEMGHRIVAQASGYICEGVFAGKTGRTPQAGRTLVTAAERNGVTLITVVMKSLEDHHYSDTIGLINYAYDLINRRVTEVNWVEKREEVVVKGTSSGVNVRMFPTTSCDIIGRLGEGEPAVRVATWGDYWSKIEYNGGYYYVSSAYLKAVNPEPPTQAPTDSEGNPNTPPTQGPTVEPTTTPVATIDVVVPPTSDRPQPPKTTEADTDEADISEPAEEPTQGVTHVPEEEHNGARSELISRIMIITVVAMVLILVIAVGTEFLPKKSKKRRRRSHRY